MGVRGQMLPPYKLRFRVIYWFRPVAAKTQFQKLLKKFFCSPEWHLCRFERDVDEIVAGSDPDPRGATCQTRDVPFGCSGRPFLRWGLVLSVGSSLPADLLVVAGPPLQGPLSPLGAAPLCNRLDWL